MAMVIEIIFTMQQEPAHRRNMAQIPSSFHYIPFTESVADVLPRGPVDRKAGVEHQRISPSQIQHPKEHGKEGDHEQQLQPNSPDRGAGIGAKEILACSVATEHFG